MMQKKMNNFFQELKKNLAEIPSRVEGTNTAEFLILLGVIFFYQQDQFFVLSLFILNLGTTNFNP